MHESICIHKKKTFLLIALFVVLCIAVGAYRLLLGQKTTYSSRAEEPKNEKYIVGGTEVTDPKKWPFMVRFSVPVRLLLDRYFCDGTLIAPRWILTAGHCVTNLLTKEVVSPGGIVVSHGSHDLTSDSMKKYTVESVFRHPEYTELGERVIHDVGLLYLSEEVFQAETITLQGEKHLEQEGVLGVHLGWGVTLNEKFPLILQQSIQPLLSNRRVNKIDWENGAVQDSELGAGYPKGGPGHCDGDSGGPLLVWDKTKWVQVGIISWSSKACGAAKHPGINTRISFNGNINNKEINYMQWISDTILEKTGQSYTGVGTFVGQDLSSKEKAEFIKRIWLNCELQKDDGQPC